MIEILISSMSSHPKKKLFTCIWFALICIGRHATLSLGWRCCDVTMTSNFRYPTSKSLCVVINATFKINGKVCKKSKGMQGKESNMSVRCG